MKIEDYFESDEFIHALEPISSYFRGGENANSETSLLEYIIGISIKYATLFQKDGILSTEGLSQFLEKIAKKIVSLDLEARDVKSNYELDEYTAKLFVDKLLDFLNLTKEDLKDKNIKRNFCSYIIKNLEEKEYKYHAFNSTFSNSIQRNGINPNFKFTPQQEINEINSIFEKYGIHLIFGWQKLNCENKVSYSTTPFVSYYYGINSPEWFSQFTGQGFPFNPYNKYHKSAYLEENYDFAKENLLSLMKNKNFSNEDKKIIFDFLKKYWDIYANKAPILAIIPSNEKKNLEQWLDNLLSDDSYKNNIERIVRICLSDGDVDCQTLEKIDTSNATFIKLPKYSTILKKMKMKEEKAKEEISDNDEMFLLEKLAILAYSKITVKKNSDGKEEWVSENGEEELLQVKKILMDNEVFKAIVTNKYEKLFHLSGWISSFHKNILTNPENIKLLALNKPTYFNCIPEELRNNIELMRSCANQEGINSFIIYYVGENVQNDFEFISNLIINSNEKTFRFYRETDGNSNESNMVYGDCIGIDIKSDIRFWHLLNAKIVHINQTTNNNFPLFSIKKELSLLETSKKAMCK